MFDDLEYCIRVEHRVLKISHNEVIITKWSKVCELYILEGSNFVFHSSSYSEKIHDKNKIWYLRPRHDGCLDVVLENFNEFYIRQGIKRPLTDELSFRFWGKVGAKTTYLVGRWSFTRINLWTPMLVCSRKYENYSYSKVTKILLIDQIKST